MFMLWVIRATRKPMLLVFRATRKLMLSYLEQQENSCFVFRATIKSMLKVFRATSKRKFMPQFQGPIFFGNFGFDPNFLTELEKTNMLP